MDAQTDEVSLKYEVVTWGPMVELAWDEPNQTHKMNTNQKNQ